MTEKIDFDTDMKNTLPFTEIDIKELVSDKIFQRGREYFKEGMVCDVYLVGNNRLEAYVEGSGYHPYKVQIEFDQSGITEELSCSCPYVEDFYDVCKHIVAVLLTVLKKPEALKTKEKLSNLLKNLDKSHLISLIKAMMETDSSLDFFVKDFIQNISPKTRKEIGKKLDSAKKFKMINKYKKLAIQIVRDLNGMSHSQAYWFVGGVVQDIQALIKKARPFLKKGDGESAIFLLTGIAEGYLQEWTYLDGSNGETPDPFYDLDEAFAEALLVADISEDTRAFLKKNIEGWIPDLEDYGVDEAFSVTLLAFKEGWSDENLIKALKGDIRMKTGVKIKETNREEEFFWRKPADLILNEVRLNILKKEKRFGEYMNLALAKGLITQYLLMQIERGNIQEVLSRGKKIISQSEESYEVFKKLKEVKALEEALEIGAMGLKFPDFTAKFGDCISELAERMHRKPLALKAIQKSFFQSPTLGRYNKTCQLADESQIKRIKDDYLKFLRSPKECSHTFSIEKIKIFLQESLFDDAIKETRHIDSQAVLTRVMDKVLGYNPDWVIKESKKRSMEIIDRGASKNYDIALDWLKWTKKGYLQKKKPKEWDKSLEKIKLKHKPKYKLISFLEQAF